MNDDIELSFIRPMPRVRRNVVINKSKKRKLKWMIFNQISVDAAIAIAFILFVIACSSLPQEKTISEDRTKSYSNDIPIGIVAFSLMFQATLILIHWRILYRIEDGYYDYCEGLKVAIMIFIFRISSFSVNGILLRETDDEIKDQPPFSTEYNIACFVFLVIQGVLTYVGCRGTCRLHIELNNAINKPKEDWDEEYYNHLERIPDIAECERQQILVEYQGDAW